MIHCWKMQDIWIASLAKCKIFGSRILKWLYTISGATEARKVCCIISRCELPFGGTMNRGVKVSKETHTRDANAGRKVP